MKVYVAIHEYTETYYSPYPEEWNRETEIVALCTTKDVADERLKQIKEKRNSRKYVVEMELQSE